MVDEVAKGGSSPGEEPRHVEDRRGDLGIGDAVLAEEGGVGDDALVRVAVEEGRVPPQGLEEGGFGGEVGAEELDLGEDVGEAEHGGVGGDEGGDLGIGEAEDADRGDLGL